jgi:predicted transcriptional regulator
VDTSKIFEMVMDKYRDKDPDQILAIVEKFRIELGNIENRALNRVTEKVIDAEYTQVKAIEAEPEKPISPAKRMASLRAKYKKKFKKAPEECITEENIFCAICEKGFKTLTKTHIATHDNMTTDEYKELCEYDKKMPLMSNKTLREARERMKEGGEVYNARQKTLDEKAAKKASKDTPKEPAAEA